jgi:hypothetical protein
LLRSREADRYRREGRGPGCLDEINASSNSLTDLIRRDLTPAQRAKLTAQRKGAYQNAHKGTGHGGAPGKAGGGKVAAPKGPLVQGPLEVAGIVPRLL